MGRLGSASRGARMIHQLCSRYGIQTVGVLKRNWARTKRFHKELESDKENQGKITNEHK